MEPNNCVTNSRKSWVKKVSNLVYLYSEAWEKYFFNGSNFSNMFYHIRAEDHTLKAVSFKSYLAKPYGSNNLYNSALLFPAVR